MPLTEQEHMSIQMISVSQFSIVIFYKKNIHRYHQLIFFPPSDPQVIIQTLSE